jgi:hypothetical protein
MTIDIQPADRRLRRVTAVALVLAALAAIVLVLAFEHWIKRLPERLPTPQLVVQLRRGIAIAMLACGLCLLLLAGDAARLARRIIEERRWPLVAMRVLRDTPIRRDAAALRLSRRFNIAAGVLIVLAIGTGWLSWRLFVAGP